MTRKWLVLGFLFTSPILSAGSVEDVLSTFGPQPVEIMELLENPETVIFDDFGIRWDSYELYLDVGKKIPGGCEYHSSSESPANPGQSVKLTHTLANNTLLCSKVVITGVPVQSQIKPLEAWFGLNEHQATSRNTTSSAATTGTLIQESASRTVKFTDGNNPYMKKLIALGSLVGYNSDGANILTLTARTGYSYYDNTQVQNNCAAEYKQGSIYKIKPTVGNAIAEWTHTDGGSCQFERSERGGIRYALSQDKNGVNQPHPDLGGISHSALCYEASPYKSCSGSYHGYPLFSQIGTAAFASAYTDEKDAIGGEVFDCSQGLTVSITKLFVRAEPRSTFKRAHSFQIIGPDGPDGPCRSNVADFIYDG